MADFIDRQDAIEALNSENQHLVAVENGYFRPMIDVINAENSIMQLPSVDAASSSPRWISTKNRVPKNNTDVLIAVKYRAGYDILMGWFSRTDGWVVYAPNCGETSIKGDAAVTHWMSLPKLPRRVDTDDE